MRSILSEGFITTIEATYDPSFEEELEPVLARMGATLMTWPGVGVCPRRGSIANGITELVTESDAP